MVADRSWEGQAVGNDLSILQDDATGKFRMWYRSFNDARSDEADKNLLNYAESTDGLSWTKPNVGLIEFDGSSANNSATQPPATLTIFCLTGDDTH